MAVIEVKTEVTGKVWKVVAEAGTKVAADDEIMILESMKMEIPITAPVDGVVRELKFGEGDAVSEDQTVALLEG